MRKATTKIINKRDTGDFNTGRYKNVCCWDWYKVFKIKGKRWDYSLFFFLEGILIVATGFVLYLDNLNFEILLNTEFCMSRQYSNHKKNLY